MSGVRERLSDGGWEVLLATGLLLIALLRQDHWYSWSTAAALILYVAVFVANISGVRAAVMVCCSLFTLLIDPDIWLGVALYQVFIIMQLLMFRGHHLSALVCSAVVFLWFGMAGPEEAGVYGMTLNIYFALGGVVVAFLVARLRVLMHVEKENLRLTRQVVENQLRSEFAVHVHDDIAGSLTRAILRVERLGRTVPTAPVPDETRAIAQSTRRALDGIHEFISGVGAESRFRPEPMTAEQVLHKQTALLSQLGMPVDVSVEGGGRVLSRQADELIGRALSEGVLNVAKYGLPGATVRIRLDVTDAVILQIVNTVDQAVQRDESSMGGGMGIGELRRSFEEARGTLYVETTGTVWMLVAMLPRRGGSD